MPRTIARGSSRTTLWFLYVHLGLVDLFASQDALVDAPPLIVATKPKGCAMNSEGRLRQANHGVSAAAEIPDATKAGRRRGTGKDADS